MDDRTEEKTGVRIRNGSDIKITNSQFIGYNKAIDASNVSNMSIDRSKVIASSINQKQPKWHKDRNFIVAIIAVIIAVIGIVVTIVIAYP